MTRNEPFSSRDPRRAALEFLYARTNYERFLTPPYTAKALKLARMRELLRRLGNPQDAAPIVHIAGTKGKGSTAVMVGNMLQAAGYRVGVFTSPHLERVEERLAVDGRPCSSDTFVALLSEMMPIITEMDRQAVQEEGAEFGPTYFEILTAIALLHFARSNVDFIVLEVGLGGRLDSTNVCRPAVTAITSISYDHTQQLGDTLERIAWEKAGIIKHRVPLVCGVESPIPREVIHGVCRELEAPVIQLGTHFRYRYRATPSPAAPLGGRFDFVYHRDKSELGLSDLILAPPGAHQAANASVALAIAVVLSENGFPIGEEAVRRALASTVVPARIEVLGTQPLTVLDASHNVASVRALLDTLGTADSPGKRIAVFGTTQGKDYRGMLQELAAATDRVILTQYTDNPRAVSLGDLAEAWPAEPTRAARLLAATPEKAWQTAAELAEPDDIVFVAGSFFLAAEIRPTIQRLPLGRPLGRASDEVSASRERLDG
ncbi:MAG: bifunctional folylpolyglutamate synthase/dihydrofolate synthase [Planctomycetota bacterium]|nr:MAG: bifunctional folylpolyglutamate synthase/dihydrofolate synthase [Planctomycetota bacterium]